MILEKLKQWDYYYKKLPLYMRNSYGIEDHFKIIFGALEQLDLVEDEVCECFDLLNDNYAKNVIAKYDDLDGYDFSFLDAIGSLYGVSRALNIEYIDFSTGNTVNKSLKLANEELYMLVKARIIQNNYDGTYLQAREYYDNIGLPIYMFTSTDNSAECYLYLNSAYEATDNIRYLFFAGYFTLQSLGITYITAEADLNYIGIWADINSELTDNNTWDVSVWTS